MPSSHTAAPAPRAGLGLALTLSYVLLFASAFTYIDTLIFLFRRETLLQAFGWAQLLFSPAGFQIVGFAAFVLGGHALLGWLVWANAQAWRARLGATAPPLRLLVLVCWLVLAVALLCANAGLAEWSDSARWFRTVARAGFAGLQVWQVVVVLALASTFPLVHAWWRRWVDRFGVRRVGLALVLVPGAVLLASADLSPARQDPDPSRRPNVIVIGIDSLRLPLTGAYGGEDTPNIDIFLRDAYHFEWSFSPLARTFVAWTSILTGQTPRSSGVRDNVMPPDAYRNLRTMAHAFGAAGYNTVFAMDEVRFAPIDERFGFEQRIGPPIGAHDFIIGTNADLPLVNVFTNTLVGRWLLPSMHANRAAAVGYRPEVYDAKFWRELRTDDRPVFLATHFTLPHHPLFWNDAPREYFFKPKFGVPGKLLIYEQMLRFATRAADAQVGRFLAEAERRGLLDDAIVVLLSDHGEALGMPDDEGLRELLVPPGIAGLEFGNAIIGHGNSTTSPTQFETLLAFRRYGGGETWRGRSGLQASLIDAAPTLLALAGVAPLARMDGADLSPVLRGAPPSPELRQRVLFTETGFSPLAIRLDPQLNERRAFLESMIYYAVDTSTGRINFRPEQVPELLAMKDRAAIAPPWVLATVPWTKVDQTLWLLYNLETRRWVRYPQDLALLGQPTPARVMEEALLAEYAGELEPPRVWPESLTARTPAATEAPP